MKLFASLGLGQIAVIVTLASVAFVFVAFGQEMFSSGPLSDQNRRNSSQGSVRSHAEIRSCSACHAPAWSSETMASRCMDCHENIRTQITGGKAMHGLHAAPEDCRACHTEHKGARGQLTSFALFNHDCAAFRLIGKHKQVDCVSCHKENPYQGTPHACESCHAEPAVHLGKFGSDCAKCHSPQTWKSDGPLDTKTFVSAMFNHDLTGFKLIGKHAAVDCKSCHVSNTFKGTPNTCVGCHAQDEVKAHKGKFGADCKSCHSTYDWKQVKFDKVNFTSVNFNHDTTAFPLTGKHKLVDCKSCHVNEHFKGTPQSCVSCHAEPSGHKPHPKTFGPQCADCHTTASWKGATLAFAKHRFPIGHGNKKNKSADNACSLCHPKVLEFVSTAPNSSYASYTCFGCHHHSLDKETKRHANRKVPDLLRCADCHKGVAGKKGKAGRPKDLASVPHALPDWPELACEFTGGGDKCSRVNQHGQDPLVALLSVPPMRTPPREYAVTQVPPSSRALDIQARFSLPRGLQVFDLKTSPLR